MPSKSEVLALLAKGCEALTISMPTMSRQVSVVKPLAFFCRKGLPMKREPSPRINAELAAKIKYLKIELGLYQHQIAAMLGINQGRVSEVLAGKRFPNVPPSDQMPLPF